MPDRDDEPERPDAHADVWGKMPVYTWAPDAEFPTICGHLPKQVITAYEGKQRARGDYAKGHPEGIVVHHLAGRDGAERAMRVAIRKNAYKYDTIGSDGTICLAGDTGRYGYHAGTSFHPALGHGVATKLHAVEVTTAGKLTEKNGKLYTWWGEEVAESDARHAKKGEWSNVTVTGWYQRFSEAQEKSLVWLLEYYKIVFGAGFQYCLGHDEVAVTYVNGHKSSVDEHTFEARLGRKNDPGGSLSSSMDDLRARVSLDKGW